MPLDHVPDRERDLVLGDLNGADARREVVIRIHARSQRTSDPVQVIARRVRRIEADVVVVGAGIAGLTRGDRRWSRRAGRSSCSRHANASGGRVLNIEIGGQANELGGQWVAPYQNRARRIPRRARHRALPELPRRQPRLHRPGRHGSPLRGSRRAARRGLRARLRGRPTPSSTRWRRSSTPRRPGPTRARSSGIRSPSRRGSRRGRRRARPRPAALLARRWLPDEAGAHVLAAAGALGDRRRRRHLRAVRARAVPRLPRRRRLAAAPAPAGGAAGRPGRARRARARDPLVDGARGGRRGPASSLPDEQRSSPSAPNLTGAIRFEPAAARLADAPRAGCLAGRS